MKINGAGNSLFTNVIGKEKSPFRMLAEVATKTYENPVKVSISEKGQESYRKSVQELTKDADSYDDVMDRKDQLLEANLSADLCYDYILGGEVNKYKQDGAYLSTKEKADNLLKAYGNIYDQIMQGYENGTWEIHVADNNSEKGYRTLTKGEEIDALNDSFKKYADSLEEQAKLEPKIEKGLKEYLNKIANIRGSKSDKVQSYLDYIKLNKEDKINPENISENMLDAVSVFQEKYRIATKNNESLSSILSNIKIFGK